MPPPHAAVEPRRGGGSAGRRRAAWAALLLGGAAISICLVRSFDAPWVVAAGREIVRTGSLPSHDPFSYTAARPWMHHEWLSEIALHLIHRVGGWPGLSLLSALLAVVPVALLARRSMAGAAPPDGPGLELLAAALLLLGLRETAEPVAQLFSNLLFAFTLRLLLDAEARRAAAEGPLPWRSVLALQLLWTQVHGGNPTGVALLGAWLLASASRRELAARATIGAAAAALTCVGPYGARVHQHFFAHRETFAAVREFQPLSAALAAGSGLHLAFVGLVLAGALALAVRASRGQPVRFEALALALFGAVTLAHVRLATETSIIATAALLPALAPIRIRARPALVLAAALLGLGLWVSPRRLGLGLDPARFPIAAVDYLHRAHPPGPLFNSYNFGGYLLWAGPEPVFIDGRAFTVYSDEQVRELVAVYDDPTRFAALEQRWGFRLAVLQRHGRGAALLELLRHRPDWSTAYEDGVALVLVRGDAPPRP